MIPAGEVSATPSAPFDWLDLSVTRPADARVLVAAVLGGVALDLAVRSGVVGAAGALAATLAAASLVATGRLHNHQAVGAAALVPAFAAWLAVRTSPWLILPDVAVIAGLLVVAASYASGGSVLDLTVPRAAVRAVHAMAHAVLGAAFGATALRSRAPARARASRGTAGAALRGLLLAAPLLIVLAVLLASADAVFAGFFRIHLDPVSAAVHVATLAIGGLGVLALLRLASSRAPSGSPLPPVRLGTIESLVVVGSLAGLFAAFAAAQLVALSEGGLHVIHTAGLTSAEYARSGFFQLLAVAAITLCALLAVRAAADLSTPRARRTFVLLSQAVVVLTLSIVFVSIRRLGLYEHAFGLTMLRLFSTVFAWWIGAVMVLLGLSITGVWRRRAWFLSAAVGIGLAALLALNAANPEALVVRRNVDHFRRTGMFDPAYARQLSEDAVPALVDSLPALDPSDRAQVLQVLCPVPALPFRGWAAYNVSRDHARESAIPLCAGLPAPAAAEGG